MTKAQLLAEVEGLRARLAALSLEALAEEHLAKLEAAAAPLERRLAELPRLEAAVMKWDVVTAVRELTENEGREFEFACKRLAISRLDSREISALNGLYRQRAEVLGVLKGRLGNGRHGELSRASKSEGAAPVRADVPLRQAMNIVNMEDRKRG